MYFGKIILYYKSFEAICGYQYFIEFRREDGSKGYQTVLESDIAFGTPIEKFHLASCDECVDCPYKKKYSFDPSRLGDKKISGLKEGETMCTLGFERKKCEGQYFGITRDKYSR